MLEFAVWVGGDPKPQPRARAFSRGGKASVYNPSTAEGWKSAVATELRPFIPDVPESGPVAVRLRFVFARPKTHYTKKGLRPEAPLYHTAAKDCDNLAKGLMDACTVIGLWRDDGQVARLDVAKTYGEKPGCMVEVRTLEATR
ncbi:MAG: RusA family crossover junction endodeoxyribonuclease [Deltaproteobacteria bacterium]